MSANYSGEPCSYGRPHSREEEEIARMLKSVRKSDPIGSKTLTDEIIMLKQQLNECMSREEELKLSLTKFLGAVQHNMELDAQRHDMELDALRRDMELQRQSKSGGGPNRRRRNITKNRRRFRSRKTKCAKR